MRFPTTSQSSPLQLPQHYFRQHKRNTDLGKTITCLCAIPCLSFLIMLNIFESFLGSCSQKCRAFTSGPGPTTWTNDFPLPFVSPNPLFLPTLITNSQNDASLHYFLYQIYCIPSSYLLHCLNLLKVPVTHLTPYQRQSFTSLSPITCRFHPSIHHSSTSPRKNLWKQESHTASTTGHFL